MRVEIDKIHENYQERVIKLQEKMQNIEINRINDKNSNCELLESDDLS